MSTFFEEFVKQTTGTDQLVRIENIQKLWSGYGAIVRCYLRNTYNKTIIVKHIQLAEGGQNPYGWNTDISHQRKLKSYQIESHFYKNYSSRCGDDCRIAHYLASENTVNEMALALEDLDAAGFPKRLNRVSWNEIELCIDWLANFHATFLNEKPEGLWETGTYWHLDTRPDELKALKDWDLKAVATEIDERLTNARFQTFVHGDAKLANFCFASGGKSVAAVDFQYVGGGCGMKDLAYFVGSCMFEEDCEILETQILNSYFIELQQALKRLGKDVDFEALEAEWRSLYYTAWTDFHRFLKGWSPGHWKLNSYSERISRQVIAEINER